MMAASRRKYHAAIMLAVAIVTPKFNTLAAEEPLPVELLVKQCAPDIHPKTMQALIATESAFNPYAIGVVNGVLDHQPHSQAEAILTAKSLEEQGYNFSMGLAQINKKNLSKYNESLETIFDPCRNLLVGNKILDACYQSSQTAGDSQQALYQALSCYYSGNPTRGFEKEADGQSYVERVISNIDTAVPLPDPVPAVPEIKAVEPINVSALPPVRRKEEVLATGWVQFIEPVAITSEKQANAPAPEENAAKSEEEVLIVKGDDIAEAISPKKALPVKALQDRQRDFVTFIK